MEHASIAYEGELHPVGRSPRVVTLSGVVDAGVTGALQKLLAQLGPEEEVVVDCRAARQWHDCALPALAIALRNAGCVVKLVGLGYHQDRVLRYLDREVWERCGGVR